MAAADGQILTSDILRDDNLDALISKMKTLETVVASLTDSIHKNQAQAAQLEAATRALNTATSAGRDQIIKNTKETDQLAQANARYNASLSANAKQLAEVRARITEQNRLNKLETQLANAKAGSYNALSAQYSLNVQRLNAMSSAERRLTNEGKELTKQTAGIRAEMHKLQSELGNNTLNVGNYSSAIQGLKTRFTDFIKGGFIVSGVMAIVQGVKQLGATIINSNSQISDSLADVRRVANLTEADADVLLSTLKGFDTRTGLNELLQFATIGGRLGVQKSELAGFTQALDSLKVALGGELGQDVEGIANKLGKLNNIFKVDGKDTGDSILRIGNAIVDLSNKGVASGEFLTDFSQRLAGISGIAKLSLGQTLGLGAGFEELGQSSEVAGTAVTQLILKIGTDVPKYARLAGKSAAEFGKTLNDNAVEALIQLSEGLTNNKDGLAEMSKAFAESEAKGVRVGATLGVIGKNADVFRQKIEDGTRALKNTDQITAAVAIKQETLAAATEKLGNIFKNLFTNSKIANFFRDVVSGVSSLVKSFADFNTVADTASGAVAKLQSEFNIEIETLQRGNLSIENRRKLIDDINTKYGEYLPKLITEKESLEDLKVAQDAANVAFKERITLLATQQLFQDLQNKFVESKVKELQLQIKLTEAQKEFESSAARGRSVAGGGETGDRAQRQAVNALNNLNDIKDAVEGNRLEQKLLEDQLKQVETAANAANLALSGKKTETKGGGGGGGSGSTGLSKEQEKALKEAQDAILAQLQAQKEYDLARLDAEKDYSNKSLEYQNNFATIRFATEQAGQIAILDKQKKFGRITETEYKAQLERIRAESVKFLNELPKVVDELGNSLKRNVNAAFSDGQGNINPLQNIFDANAEKDVKAKMQKLVDNVNKTVKTEGEKLTVFERLQDGESIYDLLGIDIDDEGKATVKSSFDFAKQQLMEFMAFRTQLANQAVANADREVQSAREALDAELADRRAGLANLVETRQKDLADAEANRQKALKQQEIAARQERLISGSQQAVNMALAISKLFATNPILAIGLGALVIGSFVGFKIAAANASKRQYGHGDYQVLKGGSHASGDDIPLGTSRNGQQEYAEGGEGRMIIPKDATTKYRSLLPEIFQALKQKDFENQFQRIEKTNNSIPLIVTVGGGATISTGGIERRLDLIHKQGQEKTIIDGKGRTITTYKNLTRIYD